VIDLDEDLRGSENRTEFALSRSGLAVLTCLAVIGRRLLQWIGHPHDVVIVVSLIVVPISGTALLLLGLRSRKGTLGLRFPSVMRLRLVTLGTLLLAGAAFGLALFPPR